MFAGIMIKLKAKKLSSHSQLENLEILFSSPRLPKNRRASSLPITIGPQHVSLLHRQSLRYVDVRPQIKVVHLNACMKIEMLDEILTNKTKQSKHHVVVKTRKNMCTPGTSFLKSSLEMLPPEEILSFCMVVNSVKNLNKTTSTSLM